MGRDFSVRVSMIGSMELTSLQGLSISSAELLPHRDSIERRTQCDNASDDSLDASHHKYQTNQSSIESAVPGRSHVGTGCEEDEGSCRPAARASTERGQTSSKPLSASSFEFGELLGEGSYSRVVKAKNLNTGEMCAIKVVEKSLIIKEKKSKYIVMEKDCLNICRHPNIIRLFCTFQDANRLYFVMEVCPKDLFSLLKKTGTFSEKCGQFYMAELVDVLKFIHSKMIIHRDLKPENMLLSDSGHIKLTDFGTARIIKKGEGRTKSFVGTAEYVSPEMLESEGSCQSSDLWALGCVAFQFFAGRVPFRGGTEYLTFQQILAIEYKFPDPFPSSAESLVQSLLVRDPCKRLGADDSGMATRYDELTRHSFFRGIEWQHPPLHQQPAPLIEPYVHLENKLPT